MDLNKPMEGDWSYPGMNSMAKTSIACLANMDDVLTKDFDGVTQTFGLIVFYSILLFLQFGKNCPNRRLHIIFI